MKTTLSIGMMLIVGTFTAMLLGQTTAPASQPVRKWGKMAEDLRVAAAPEGAWSKSAAPLRLAIENVGARDADLKGAFAWLLIGYEGGTVYYTDKLDLAAVLKTDTLTGSAVAETPVDLAKLKTFAMVDGQTVVGGYPKADAPQAKGTLGDLLTTTAGKGQVVIVLPGRNNAMVKSGPIPIVAGSPLIRSFARDEFAAMAAHDEAVKRGKEVVPELIDALDGTSGVKLPGFGQMWVVAALCDLRDQRAVPALVRAVNRGGPAASVVAYHGPKMQNAELNEAVVKAAGKNDAVAAWAARGFAVHGGKLHWDLVEAGLRSKDPKVRAGLAEGLVKDGGPKAMEALGKLLGDSDEAVRVEAAQWVGKSGTKKREVWAAAARALDVPGDTARAAICEALEKLTGRKGAYPAKGTREEKEAAVAGWKAWIKAP